MCEDWFSVGANCSIEPCQWMSRTMHPRLDLTSLIHYRIFGSFHSSRRVWPKQWFSYISWKQSLVIVCSVNCHVFYLIFKFNPRVLIHHEPQLRSRLFLSISTHKIDVRSSLLYSIITAMAAYCVSFFVQYHNNLPIIITILVSGPVILFFQRQLLYLKNAARTTYRNRPKRHMLYYQNPRF